MKLQNTIQKAALVIAAIYAIITFGGAIVILSSI
jgi:hypothetical protein